MFSGMIKDLALWKAPLSNTIICLVILTGFRKLFLFQHSNKAPYKLISLALILLSMFSDKYCRWPLQILPGYQYRQSVYLLLLFAARADSTLSLIFLGMIFGCISNCRFPFVAVDTIEE